MLLACRVCGLRHVAGPETRSPAQQALVTQAQASKLPVPLGLAKQEGRLSPSPSLILAKAQLLAAWRCVFPPHLSLYPVYQNCSLAIFQST